MLNYYCQGSGKGILVLVHGFCENNTCFNEQVLFFKGTHTVITVDLSGFGNSPVIPDVSIDKMAEELYQTLKHLQVNTCVVLGHSMGGYVVMAMAEKYPELLAGFGLIHSVATADNEERKEKRKQVVSFIEKNGKEAYIRNFIPGLFAESNQGKPYVETFVKEALKGPQEGITTAALAMMNRPDRLEVLKNAKVPVFFGVGKNDSLIPEEAMFRQAAMPVVSHICYLQQAGHVGMVEEPEKLNLGILEFLNAL